MIRTIGVLAQDAISLGFLEGLKARLGCAARMVPPPVNAGENRRMTLKQKRIACKHFLNRGVDIVVRFTDADQEKWQDIQRDELRGFPPEFQQRVVCGVAVNNPEEWLALAPEYLDEKLSIKTQFLRSEDRASAIKTAISRARGIDDGDKDVARRLVIDAPDAVFRKWLRDDAFRQFYQDCRGIAVLFGREPEPTNEL